LTAQIEKCSKNALKSCFLGFFPILSWLQSYKKEDLLGDVISGCTVAIMHIPQGMGYALLGNLPPVVGIYMAFYPVLMYVVFGTSRHNSMGKKIGRVLNLGLGKLNMFCRGDLKETVDKLHFQSTTLPYLVLF
jgi:hypothetical protein